MEVIKLTRDNVSDFEELIPEDIAENMGRTSKVEKQLLNEMGFTVGLMEGDEIVAHLSEIAEIPFLKFFSVRQSSERIHNTTAP